MTRVVFKGKSPVSGCLFLFYKRPIIPRHRIVIFSADEHFGCPITETKRIGHLGSMKTFSGSVRQDP